MRARDQSGLSLIEMLVALFVVGVVLTAMASVAMTSLRAVQSDERTVRSTQLGNEILESLLVVPYDLVGLYASEADAHFGQASFEGEDLVLLADPADPQDREDLVPVPAWQETRDGIEYEVELAITWVDDPDTASVQDYKRVIVMLSWEVRGRPSSARVEALRAPGPGEQPLSARVEPDVIRIHERPEGKNDDAFTIFVTSKVRQSAVKVSWVGLKNSHERSLTQTDADGQEWSVSFNANTWQFHNGETLFAVTATAPDGVQETTTIARALFLYDLAIDLDNYHVAPTELRITDEGELCEDEIQMEVLVVGATRSDSVLVRQGGDAPDDDEGWVPLVVDAQPSDVGTWFTGGLDTAELEIGDGDSQVEFTIRAVRAIDGQEDVVTDSVAIEWLEEEEPC